MGYSKEREKICITQATYLYFFFASVSTFVSDLARGVFCGRMHSNFGRVLLTLNHWPRLCGQRHLPTIVDPLSLETPTALAPQLCCSHRLLTAKGVEKGKASNGLKEVMGRVVKG